MKFGIKGVRRTSQLVNGVYRDRDVDGGSDRMGSASDCDKMR